MSETATRMSAVVAAARTWKRSPTAFNAYALSEAVRQYDDCVAEQLAALKASIDAHEPTVVVDLEVAQ